MIDRIIISQDRTRATLIFTDRVPFGIETDAGDLIDLIIFFTSEFKSMNEFIEYQKRIESQDEITQSIDLSQFENRKVA